MRECNKIMEMEKRLGLRIPPSAAAVSVGFVVCILGMLLCAHPARAQPGFISIDCGAEVGFTDPTTGISYVADTNITTGSTAKNLVSDFKELTTLRYFPAASTPKKNCYEVPVEPNNQYLVRALFFYNSYATAPASIDFQLSLDATVWTNVSIDSTLTTNYYWVEAIYYTRKTSLSVCLIRTDDASTPFISSLELRLLPTNIYIAGRTDSPATAASVFLHSLRRRDFGNSGDNVRYPDDAYDRIWESYTTVYASVSAPAGQEFVYDNVSDLPPNKVMQTAITDPAKVSYSITLDPKLYAFVYVTFYIAQVEVVPAGTSRIMDVTGNFFAGTDPLDTAAGTPFLINTIRNFTFPLPNTGNPADSVVSVVLEKDPTSTSTLGPLLNAMEVYGFIFVSNDTDATEVTALSTIRSTLGVNVWAGDPCFPIPWSGVNCTGDQVTSIDLSNQGLRGLIPDFSALTTLTSLDLSDNNFTGPLPDWVAGLSSLKTLDVSNNQLNGTFPATYISTIPGFRYANNLQLTCVPSDVAVCPSVPAPAQPPPSSTPRGVSSTPPPPTTTTTTTTESKKSSSSGAVIGAVVGGILVVAVIVGVVVLYCCWWKPKKSQVKIQPPQSPLMNISLAAAAAGQGTTPLHVPGTRGKAQPFTLLSVKEATNNFARKIGEGGFGPVYFGTLSNQQEVAVKVMSGKTQQGFSEFSNEIDLLSTVHYKKLVSLVGYCQEGKDLILLYEYMSGGDLRQRLYGSRASHFPLNWRQRLQIALDAAKGLDYLHHGCNPAIFHRDVKSSNILLTEKLEAKVADFGLSKLTDVEQSHVMTMVKGTLGYLDPEYNTTGMLTEKSDVYSFGVVLLEILSGQSPIAKDGPNKFIVDRVRAAMNTGNLEAVVDPGLRGDYKIESVWKLAEVAMSCVPISAISRPGMTKVVAELDQVLEIEFGGQVNTRREYSSGSDVFTTNSHSNPSYTNGNYSTASTLPPEPPSQIFHQDVRPRAY